MLNAMEEVMFRHILTATDGSDWALRGVTVAFDMAKALEARLTVVHASESYSSYFYAEEFSFRDREDEARLALSTRADSIFADLKPLAETRSVNPEFVYVPDSAPAVAIYEKAEDLGCDLIVIGSRGRRGLTKLLLGSQAAEVLAGTKLPVLIVQ